MLSVDNKVQKIPSEKKGETSSMAKNYVISTEDGYVEYAQITSVDGLVQVQNALYTKDLQKAKLYTEEDYKEDLVAWETFLGIKEGHGFAFLPAEIKVTIL